MVILLGHGFKVVRPGAPCFSVYVGVSAKFHGCIVSATMNAREFSLDTRQLYQQCLPFNMVLAVFLLASDSLEYYNSVTDQPVAVL